MAQQERSTQTREDKTYRAEGLTRVLMSGTKTTLVKLGSEQLTLPEPVFPQYPDKLGDLQLPAKYLPKPGGSPYIQRASLPVIQRGLRGWLTPFLRSRILPGEFHPLIAYLFTEYKCNLDCHYCWAYNNHIRGMSEDTARRSVDWLHDNGCRVLALMGGEVLLRPQFAQKIVYYAAKKGFFVYVPTNGRLMRPEVIDRLGDAGVATVNLAVDSVEDRPELPKALRPIERQFEYLIKKQYIYGFSVFFNINITRINMDDVRQLTEIAHDSGIATDYHLNESPMLEQADFKHKTGNSTFFEEKDYPQVDETIDWLVEKSRSGYKMVNSVSRLLEMKHFLRGKTQQWNCRAGQNSLIIRTDGTLAPCFPTYNATHDWGSVGNHSFDVCQLNEMKKECQRNCFSTLNHILGHCYDTGRVVRWFLKQAAHGFQGATGTIED